jgi:hypothetical protein
VKINLNLLSIAVLLNLFLINSCKKEEPNLPPEDVSLTSPANNSTEVVLSATLSWQTAKDPEGDDIVYDVYLGADANPSTIVSPNQTSTDYSPALIANTTYYWKVIAKDPNGESSQSNVWTFSTLNNGPETVSLTAPVDGATDVATDAALTWQSVVDPDGDEVSYEVLLGTEETPVTTVITDQAETTFAPTLSANTNYFWKVIAKDDKGGVSESAIWNFTTLNNNPGAVILTSPSNAASDISGDSNLTWEISTDPDGDDIVYDVYLDTEVIPATIVSSDQEEHSYAPALDVGTTYYWKVVAKDPHGGISESAVWSFTVGLEIGDFYQGGIVFYLDETGLHGLVCPIFDQSPTPPEVHAGWGCATVDGADAMDIGSGLQNTMDIIAACSTEGTAAEICANLTLNGYSDWFLPSIYELQAMNQNRDIITEYALANGGSDFIAHYYYSSSESTDFYAFAYGFGSQQQVFQVGKLNYNYPFRAVRAF